MPEVATENAKRPSDAGAADSMASVNCSPVGASSQVNARCRPPPGGRNARQTSSSWVSSTWVEYRMADPSDSHAARRSGPLFRVSRTGGDGLKGWSVSKRSALKGSLCPHPNATSSATICAELESSGSFISTSGMCHRCVAHVRISRWGRRITTGRTHHCNHGYDGFQARCLASDFQGGDHGGCDERDTGSLGGPRPARAQSRPDGWLCIEV